MVIVKEESSIATTDWKIGEKEREREREQERERTRENERERESEQLGSREKENNEA